MRLCSGSDQNFDHLESRESAEITYSVTDALDGLPITYENNRSETACDATSQKVLSCIQNSSWPKRLLDNDDKLRDFNSLKNSLCVENGLVLLQRDGNSRIVILVSLHEHVLKLLDEAHWGITRMKQMARRYVWWSNINGDIENMVQLCEQCRCHE